VKGGGEPGAVMLSGKPADHSSGLFILRLYQATR
jgi:hypothetical protein